MAFALQQFGTGGVPQTRSAVTAAVANAADQAAGTEQKAKVLLVTTGTAQDMDDPTFQQALADAKSDNVSLSVVHIGPGEKDAVLDDAADSFSGHHGPPYGILARAEAGGSTSPTQTRELTDLQVRSR